MKKYIGRLIFWLIKDYLEGWNMKKAQQRVRFYSDRCRNTDFKNKKDQGLENYCENSDLLTEG